MKKYQLKYFLVILIQFIISTNSVAQLELKGIVVEDKTNDPLPGVNIIEKNTENRTFTDFNGKFKITVSDTATIRISSAGYLNKIMKAKEYQGDTIKLTNDNNIKEIKTIIDCFPIYNSSYFGYFGDFKRLPYGFSISHQRKYLCSKFAGLSGQINYKTDTKSNYDVKFFLKKNNLIKINRFRLSAIVSFQKRQYQELNVNDFEFVLEKKILIGWNFLLGYTMKKNFIENPKLNNGALIGINKNFENTLTYISSNFKIFGNFNEYNFSILQGFPIYNKSLRNINIGVEYQHYQNFNVFNFTVIFGFYNW